ncbi:MAG: hypothetical protein J7J15_02875 [Candidatus Aenigmarchaeota archaeon]|nr:hypothetical protein [Candidatus Aenigmarchaeota archaeon]
MKVEIYYLLILSLSILFIYFVRGPVIIFASLMVIFEKCFFSRINVIPGIEFTSLATLLVVLKYGVTTGILFVIFLPLIIPTIINNFIGEKFVLNKDFVMMTIGFGNLVDILCVFIIYFLRNFDIFWIMLIILISKHTLNNLAGKLKETNFVMDYIEIAVGFLFNLFIVYFFHSFWLSLLAV